MRRALVLLRHGRTAWNHEGRAQGPADIPLDQTGRAQADRAAEVLGRLGAVALWSSDLVRARETAEAVGIAAGLPVRLDKRLREFDVGARAGMTWAEAFAAYPEGVPGEEAVEDVASRMGAALRECFATLADGEVGIVVAHGACLKDGIGDLLGWAPRLAREWLVGMGNCSWARVEDVDGRTRLASYNVGVAPDFASSAPGR